MIGAEFATIMVSRDAHPPRHALPLAARRVHHPRRAPRRRATGAQGSAPAFRRGPRRVAGQQLGGQQQRAGALTVAAVEQQLAGGAALVAGIRPTATPSQVTSVLSNAKYIGSSMGSGRLDLEEAIEAARAQWPTGAQSPIPNSCYAGEVDWTDAQ